MTRPTAGSEDARMDEPDLDPREAARARRRDRDAAAAARDLMRPGMGKVFKQILDRQGREARETREPAQEDEARAARTSRSPRKGR